MHHFPVKILYFSVFPLSSWKSYYTAWASFPSLELICGNFGSKSLTIPKSISFGLHISKTVLTLSWKNAGENGEDEANNLTHFCFALECIIRNGIDIFSSVSQSGFLWQMDKYLKLEDVDTDEETCNGRFPPSYSPSFSVFECKCVNTDYKELLLPLKRWSSSVLLLLENSPHCSSSPNWSTNFPTLRGNEIINQEEYLLYFVLVKSLFFQAFLDVQSASC